MRDHNTYKVRCFNCLTPRTEKTSMNVLKSPNTLRVYVCDNTEACIRRAIHNQKTMSKKTMRLIELSMCKQQDGLFR